MNHEDVVMFIFLFILIAMYPAIYAYFKIKHTLEIEHNFRYWLRFKEVNYRTDASENGYPLDWKYRRYIIILKYNGKCAFCGRQIGNIGFLSKYIWTW